MTLTLLPPDLPVPKTKQSDWDVSYNILVMIWCKFLSNFMIFLIYIIKIVLLLVIDTIGSYVSRLID